MGAFATIMTELVAQAQLSVIVIVYATHAKAHRTATSLADQKEGARTVDRSHKFGLNSKLQVQADAKGRPIGMFLSAG